MTSSVSLDETTAKEWMSSLENVDGTTGPHWTMEQTEIVKNQRGIQWAPVEFWVAMCLVYAKCSAVFQSFGVRDQIFLYADMARVFLENVGRLTDYYKYIVRH